MVALATIIAGPAAAGGATLDLGGLQDGAQHDRFIIKYRDGSPRRADAARVKAEFARGNAVAGGARIQHLRRMSLGADVLKSDRKLDRVQAEALMRQLAADPEVEYVEVDQLLKPTLTPNDSKYAQQWHYFDATGGIRADKAWDKSTGQGVVVAVIDTGITRHPDLDANVLPGYDLISDAAVAVDGDGRDSDASDVGDWYGNWACGNSPDPRYEKSNSSWHGTHVAGTIAAVTNNASGVAGVAHNARIVPVRVLGRCGGYNSDISDGIVWASGGTVSGVPANPNPAEVLNLSLGGAGTCSATTQAAINGAVQRGATVVVAAGNDNANASGYTPGNCSNVVLVASTTQAGARSGFSNYGSGIDVAAPGSNILSTINTGTSTPGAAGYTSYDGTSMATPHVVGVIALMQSVAATPRTPAQIESILKQTLRPFPVTPDQPIGTGIVNAEAAVNAVLPASGGGTLSKGVAATGLSAATGTALGYTLTVPAGASNLTFTTSGGTGDVDMYVRFGSAPTDSVYDCRPYKSGNAESCTFAAPSAGTYYVSLKAYAAFSGLSLLGNYSTGTSGGTQTYSNSVSKAIVDNGTVTSALSVSGRIGNAASASTVAVNITHTYRGDVKLDLLAPDGSVYALKASSSSDSADNVVASYTVDLSSEALNGAWSLRVQDVASGDTGTLNSWSVTF